MNNLWLKYKYLGLAAVVILASVLLFVNLGRPDIQHDDATYSFRALGYLDYMSSQLQTTPVHWFDQAPAWAELSFHDHPPLTFIIQHSFFKLFGFSVFISRLPYALAGVGSVLLLFFVVKKMYDDKVAFLAALIFSVLTIHAWTSRIAYLEPIALFFILLTVYFFILAREQEKFWLLFGLFLGLTLLTKYTVLFIVPGFLIYLLIYHRKTLLNKYFILSLVLAAIIFSPVVYYNFKMYQARGHFDLQLSVLFNQDRSDWPGISRSSAGVDFFGNFFRIFKDLFAITSLPMYFMLVTLTAYGVFKSFSTRRQNHANLLFFFFLLFGLILISSTGSVVRFNYLLVPFIVIISAWAILDVYQNYVKGKVNQKTKTIIFSLIIVAVIIFELFYNLNTNVLAKPIGEKTRAYSAYRWENGGFNQLETYLINQGLNFKIVNQVNSLKDLSFNADELGGKDVFVYDPNLDWFSTLWYFQKWSVYNKEFFISAADLFQILPNTNWFEFFKAKDVKTVYYIRGANETVFGPSGGEPVNQQSASALESIFTSAGAQLDLVRNANGQLAFKIYQINLQE